MVKGILVEQLLQVPTKKTSSAKKNSMVSTSVVNGCVLGCTCGVGGADDDQRCVNCALRVLECGQGNPALDRECDT